MPWHALATIADPAAAWIAFAVIAAWVVFMSLRCIGHDLEHAIRWRRLRVEAQTLRLRQMQRLAELSGKQS